MDHEFHELLSEKQVAERLQVPPRTLQDWRYRGVGPEYIKIGGHVRYDRLQLEQYLREQTRTATFTVA